MGCVSSSSHKKKPEASSSAPEKLEQNPKSLENGNQNSKVTKNPMKSEHALRNGTDPNSNIAHVKDSETHAKGHSRRQQPYKEQVNGAEMLGQPKSSTKETHEKTHGTGNLAAGTQQSKQEDVGRILDDDILKDLQKDANKSLDKKSYVPDQDPISYRIDKDSFAIDFEGNSPIFGPNGFFDPRRENWAEEEAEKSLTLNLTDLKIEQHQ